ncbi:hypothetical protein POVWA2_017780 [Plasmodium ovale wallikeri]|uniref:Uncharacterized protein n=1 Tax=Plasmodium ovale wallikeri TaxID=864142 RepID=A0A1A8YQW6_PLAOA|nr:hypothetical protein POVWA2_017780 [Plasmodium ovale wallikeri]
MRNCNFKEDRFSEKRAKAKIPTGKKCAQGNYTHRTAHAKDSIRKGQHTQRTARAKDSTRKGRVAIHSMVCRFPPKLISKKWTEFAALTVERPLQSGSDATVVNLLRKMAKALGKTRNELQRRAKRSYTKLHRDDIASLYARNVQRDNFITQDVHMYEFAKVAPPCDEAEFTSLKHDDKQEANRTSSFVYLTNAIYRRK